MSLNPIVVVSITLALTTTLDLTMIIFRTLTHTHLIERALVLQTTWLGFIGWGQSGQTHRDRVVTGVLTDGVCGQGTVGAILDLAGDEGRLGLSAEAGLGCVAAHRAIGLGAVRVAARQVAGLSIRW